MSLRDGLIARYICCCFPMIYITTIILVIDLEEIQEMRGKRSSKVAIVCLARMPVP